MLNHNALEIDRQSHFPLNDLQIECLNHMSSNELPNSEKLIIDGKIHRYSRTGHKNKKDEWYVAFDGKSTKMNPYLVCIYGSWSQGTKFEYKSWEQELHTHYYDEKERKALHESMAKKRKAVEQKLKEERDQAAKEAKKIWEESSSTPDERSNQPKYLEKKGVKAYSIKYGKNPQGYDSIIIPINNIDCEIRSLQFISSSGTETYKTFYTSGEKRGNFFQIGEIKDGEEFYVVEGYATGASIHEATSRPVIVAFDSGNISNVIENLRKKYPSNKITIAADGRNEKGNIGEEKAVKAAKSYDCKVIVPSFPKGKQYNENGEMFTDFNDLHKACGIDEVQRQLSEYTNKSIFKSYSLTELLEMSDKEWLIENIIGPNDLGMVFGAPGAGKTFAVIDMIMCCCSGKAFAQKFKVRRKLNVAYCAGEGVSGLRSRFYAAVKKHNIATDSLCNFTFYSTIPQLFNDSNEPTEEAIQNFIKEWKSNQDRRQATPLDILIIDTLHTASVGAEENSSKDMGKVLHHCRTASNELGCAVVLVHHANKAGTNERGSSALRGGMDVIIEIKKLNENGNISSMKCSKLKDGEHWQKQNFSLRPVDGTKSVSVEWRDACEYSETSGKQATKIEAIICELNANKGVKFKVKQIAEVIGESDNYTRKLLAGMVEKNSCKRELMDPKNETSKSNPYLYWIE